MSVIDLVPLEDLAQSAQRSMISEAQEFSVPDPVFFQVFGHVPGYSEALYDALHRSHYEGNVDHKLKEIIRIRLARQVGDPYFSNLRSKVAFEDGLTEDRINEGCNEFENSKEFSLAEKWGLSYSKYMYLEPQNVNKDFYNKGKEYTFRTC